MRKRRYHYMTTNSAYIQLQTLHTLIPCANSSSSQSLQTFRSKTAPFRWTKRKIRLFCILGLNMI